MQVFADVEVSSDFDNRTLGEVGFFIRKQIVVVSFGLLRCNRLQVLWIYIHRLWVYGDQISCEYSYLLSHTTMLIAYLALVMHLASFDIFVLNVYIGLPFTRNQAIFCGC